MKFSKSKFNVALGALTGLLVGFVFGVGLGSSSGVSDADGSRATGDVVKISQIRKSMIKPADRPLVQADETIVKLDTMAFASKDEEGNDIKVIIIKEK